MREERFNKIVLPRKRYSKYRAKRCERINPDGSIEKYASQKEMLRHQVLLLLEKAGKIRDLKRQVPFILEPSVTINGKKIPPLRYIVDFVYINVLPVDKDYPRAVEENTIYEDVKGMKTRVYKIKRHIMKSKFNIDILET